MEKSKLILRSSGISSGEVEIESLKESFGVSEAPSSKFILTLSPAEVKKAAQKKSKYMMTSP